MKKKKIMLSITTVLVIVGAFIGIFSSHADKDKKKDLVIGVISDTHYYSKSLYGDCKDFEEYSSRERQLFKEGNAVLDSALKIIEEEAPDVLLIPGDMAKEGEKVNEIEFASKIQQSVDRIKAKGKETKVYVINGNHDINNPKGRDFSSGKELEAEQTTTKDFREIYKNMGYGSDSELYTTKNNVAGCMSYVARIAEGYTLIAVDTNKYSADHTDSGKDIREIGGDISSDLLKWVNTKAKEAKDRGDEVIIMQHHAVVPHFNGEEKYRPKYVVKNYTEVREVYADAGINMVFTGHMHANDISQYTSKKNNTIYDIETGSLISHPSPIRIVKISGDSDSNKKNKIDIQTRFVEKIDYVDESTGNKIDNLYEYSKKYIFGRNTINSMITKDLIQPNIEKIIEGGGTKKYLAKMFGVKESEVNGKVAEIIKNALPQEEENGIKINILRFDFNIYYDVNTDNICLKEVSGNKILPLQLHISIDKLKNIFLDKLYVDLDYMLKTSDKEIETLVNTFLDSALDYKIDNEHTLVKFIQEVYIPHLAGEEKTAQWVKDYIEKIKSNEAFREVVNYSSDKSSETALQLSSQIRINIKDILEKGNNGMKTNVAYGLLTRKFKDTESIVDFILNQKMVVNKVADTISGHVYGLVNGLANDDNYIEDNNTTIEY